REPPAHALGAGEGALPLLVGELGRVVPRRGGPGERALAPRLVRVAGDQQPLADPEGGVGGGQRVGRAVEVGWIHGGSHRPLTAARGSPTGRGRAGERAVCGGAWR